MQKIDLKELRERVRSAYADFDAKDNPALAFQARNADLMADLAVALMREMVGLNTPVEDVMNGFVAIVAMALTNLCNNYKLDPEHVIENMSMMLHHFLVNRQDMEVDMVQVPKVDVGDA